MIRTHTFRGKSFGIFTSEEYGGVTFQGADRRIAIFHPLDSRMGLEYLIHESLHACDWGASEKSVSETARDIARLLWRLGYRKQK